MKTSAHPMSYKFICILLAAVGMVGLASATRILPARAQGTDDPHKVLTVLVSHAAGGGYDAYARLYARHIGRFLPGHPVVTVRNMPGAAGVVMANHLASQAVRTGSVIGVGPGSLATAGLFGSQGARDDARGFGWIGSLNNDISVTVSRSDSGVSSFADLFARELVVGGAGASDNSVIFANILQHLFGAKLKLVAGYDGSGATVLALERGEVQGIAGWNYSSITTMKPDWLKDGSIHVLVQFSPTRHPALPDVPTVLDVARTDAEREVLRLICAHSLIGRVIFAPPGVPKEILAEQRSAFSNMLGDADFLADATRERLEINGPLVGADIDPMITELYRAAPDRVKEAAALMGGS